MSRTNINPYKIGIELMRDIEHRWNTGKFGREYQESSDMKVKESWNRETNLGREKIFEVGPLITTLPLSMSISRKSFVKGSKFLRIVTIPGQGVMKSIVENSLKLSKSFSIN